MCRGFMEVINNWRFSLSLSLSLQSPGAVFTNEGESFYLSSAIIWPPSDFVSQQKKKFGV
jgi:hypothetical protein